MAGIKVNDYAEGDVNATAIMTTLDNQRKGYYGLSLTNFDNTSAPAIAAGSVIEVNNSLYKFDTETAITGSPSDGDVYIIIVPSGDTATAEYTNTAPTWSDSKQGWYGTGGSANNRYVGFVWLASGLYTGKMVTFRGRDDFFLMAHDVTERTTTSASQVDEENLTLTIPMIKGCAYEIILFAEIKTSVNFNEFNIYNRKTSGTDLILINFDDATSNDSTINTLPYLHNATTNYKKIMLSGNFIAAASGNYVHKSSVKVDGGATGTYKNRSFSVRPIKNIHIPIY